MSERGTERRLPEAGFTILEVMVACTVLVVGIFGLMSVLTYSTRQEQVNLQYSIALNAARARLEQVKNTSYGNLGTWNTVVAWPHDCSAVGNHNDFEVEGLTTDPRFISQSSAPAGSIVVDLTDPDLAEVTVTVRWLNAMALVTEVKLETKIADD